MCYFKDQCLVIILFSSMAAVESKALINSYIDNGIDYIRNNEEMMLLIDPLHIPDINKRKLRTWNMELTGLSSLHRSGNCTLMYERNQTILEGNFAADNLHIKFHYKAKNVLWISGRVKMDVSRMSIKISAYLDVYTGRLTFHNFKVVDFGDVKITKITGFSRLFNGLVRHITNLILKHSKAKVIRYVEDEGSKLLASKLAEITYLKDNF